jgi:hypothetical protein
MLWGLINCLQLITHIPLFSVIYPANAKYFYKLILSTSQFDLIDNFNSTTNILKFTDNAPYNDRCDELDIF